MWKAFETTMRRVMRPDDEPRDESMYRLRLKLLEEAVENGVDPDEAVEAFIDGLKARKT